MGEESISELCRRFGISRKTGYKRINRFKEYGYDGLGDRSSAPHSHPNATSPEVARQLIEAKRAHPTWGPKKLVAWLRAEAAEAPWPAPSTAGAILDRAGLVKRRRRRRSTAPWSEPFIEAVDANDVWCIDFKGWFRTGDGKRVDPAYRAGCGVALPAGMRRSGPAEDISGAPGARQVVSGVRPAADDPHGQRPAVRQRRTGRADDSVDLVGQAGDHPGAHRTRPPRAERQTGAVSQNAQ